MSNDVIELAKKLRSSLENERELIGEYPTIFFGHYLINAENIVKICREIENLHKKLAEYENMEPVAYMIFDENFNEPMAYKDNKEEAEQSLSFYRRVCCCKIIPLYRHPNK
ncbi:hypothetical protein [Xenorhabdus budapestensis]|uniref:Uncharacterized protein n=1 Tax=Xenorhabdus budapestensis TaxID=290110 RepID=A0A2D0J3Q6_XENBU|nr:hypothetical protein [Xenorhabdus budapestensis]PHM29106.1 hypothetical protein Xbud_00547 [Xenorhabdus budapestensis]